MDQARRLPVLIRSHDTDVDGKCRPVAVGKIAALGGKSGGGILAMPPAVHRKGFVEGVSCAHFDCAAILKINAADDFEVVVQVDRLRRVPYDEIPCAAADKAEIRPYVIRVLERMAEILHKLAAHAADTAQEFLVLHIVKHICSFPPKALRSVMLGR